MSRWVRPAGPTNSVTAKGDVLVAPEGAGCVLLHVPSGTYLRLDRSATEIFRLVEEVGLEATATALVERYGIDRDTAEADVASIIEAVRGAQSKPQKKARRPRIRGGLAVCKEWISLPGRPQLVVLFVAVATVLVEIALRLLAIGTLSRLVGAPLRDPQGDEAGLPEVEVQQLSVHEQLFLASIEWTLNRWVFDATCLRRALLGAIALRSHRPSLRIGLIEDGSDLAHAWLRCDTFTLGALPGDVRAFSQPS